MSETPTLFVCHGDDGGPRRHPCRRVQEALNAAGIDYEKVIAQLKGALSKSEAPEAKQQLAGWKIIKNAMPNPDGSIVYIHIISPVVKGADYSVMNNIYAAVKDPAEQKAVFEMYRAAMKAPLFVIQGPMVADLSK